MQCDDGVQNGETLREDRFDTFEQVSNGHWVSFESGAQSGRGTRNAKKKTLNGFQGRPLLKLRNVPPLDMSGLTLRIPFYGQPLDQVWREAGHER